MPSRIRTRVAHAEWGDNRFRGFSVAKDLAGRETWLGLLVLGVTGRRLSEAERGTLDDLGVAMTVADPRIWPLKLTRLVAAYGGAVPALACGALSLDEAFIGHATTGEALRFLVAVRQAVRGPDDLLGLEDACRARLAQPRSIAGYGVVGREIDERVVILSDCMAKRGRDKLEYWTLFSQVSEVLFRLKGWRPNVFAAAAATFLDLGFDERQTRILASFLGLSDFLANAAEGAELAPAVLRSLDTSSVRYVGPPARQSPRARR